MARTRRARPASAGSSAHGRPPRASPVATPRPPSKWTRLWLIGRMEWARRAHLIWARRQERRRRKGKKPTRFVGSATHHRRWVYIYDRVIELLRDEKG